MIALAIVIFLEVPPSLIYNSSAPSGVVNAVKSDPLIDQNYVQNVFGHGSYKTTEWYGNHVHEISSDQRAARRQAVKRAMPNVVSFPRKYVS